MLEIATCNTRFTTFCFVIHVFVIHIFVIHVFVCIFIVSCLRTWIDTCIPIYWKFADERVLMDTLPKNLRTDLAIHVHFNTLSKVKLFQDCDKTLLFDLVLKLKPILYLPGDYVCRKVCWQWELVVKKWCKPLISS